MRSKKVQCRFGQTEIENQAKAITQTKIQGEEEMKAKAKKSAMEEVEPTFDNDIATMIFATETFRDLLREEASRMTRAKIEHNQHGASLTMPEASYDPQRHAHLHRMRMAADSVGAVGAVLMLAGIAICLLITVLTSAAVVWAIR
jgi:hypothetical protein